MIRAIQFYTNGVIVDSLDSQDYIVISVGGGILEYVATFRFITSLTASKSDSMSELSLVAECCG